MVQENAHVNAEIAIAMQKHQRYARTKKENIKKTCHLNLSLGNSTLLETLLDTLGNARGDSSLELRNIGSVDRLSESSRHNIRGHGKQLIGDLASAKIFVIE
jgi:hypothetical protein